MTNYIGTKCIPKDLQFEILLKKYFHADKFEKIIYYDSCIIVKDKKSYGKIIIFDDSVYSYADALKKFTIAASFKDIYSVEMINDMPMFIFGQMREKTIHIHIKFYKSLSSKTEIQTDFPFKKEKSTKSTDFFTEPNNDQGISGNNNNNSISEKFKDTMNRTIDSLENAEDSIDFYILNPHSIAYLLLKKARIDYLIRETVACTLNTVNKSLYLSQNSLNRLFDSLLLDLTTNKSSISVLQKYLLELIESGLKYHRIKVLFWSKPTIFEFIVIQFNEKRDYLVNLKDLTHKTTRTLIHDYLGYLNVLLQVFNTFLFETDHFITKAQNLRIHNGKVVLSLLNSNLCLIAFLNDCDRNNEHELVELSDLEFDIDCLKHSITMSSVQLFYNLLCSSEIYVGDLYDDSFSSRTVFCLLESLITYDSCNGVLNKFINQALQMQFIWIFPTMFKIKEENLTSERIISLYQFFSSMKTIVLYDPKFFEIFRREMVEEFQYFMLNDVSFPLHFPLSAVTLKLLKSFQKNMVNNRKIFID